MPHDLDELHWVRQLLYRILSNQEKFMATAADLASSFDALKAKMEAFIAAQAGAISPAALDALKAGMDALAEEIPPVA